MNQTARQILAMFVMARRKYQGLTPAKLSRELNIDAAQIRAAERCQNVKAASVETLGAWCGIELIDGGWVVAGECHASH